MADLGNWNADDPNNPLVQLMQGRNQYGNVGRFLPIGIQPGGQSQHASMVDGGAFDPRYWEEYIEAGDAGTKAYRPRQSTLDKLKGRHQVFRANVGGPGGVKDPGQVDYDDEFGLLTDPSNINAPEDNMAMFNAIMIAAGLATGGAITANMAAGGGAAAGGGFGGVSTEMLPSLTQPSMGTMVPAATAEGAGGLGSLGAATGGGGGAGGLSIEMLPQLAQPGALNAMAPAATAGGGGGIVSALGGYGNIARGAMGLASLGSSSGGGGSGGGGSGSADSMIDQMARVNRVDHDTPIGSRRWTEGPDGRWSVKDSMDPAEEANFRQVQGMNADVTGMARQRLAALLAGPPRQRADAPINIAGFNIGG